MVWRFLIVVSFFLQFDHHGIGHLATSSTQSQSKRSAGLVSSSERLSSAESDKVEGYPNCLERPSLPRRPVFEAHQGGHEGQRHDTMEMQAVHATEETYRTVLSHLSDSLASLHRSHLCAPSSCYQDRGAVVCDRLESAGHLGLFPMGSNRLSIATKSGQFSSTSTTSSQCEGNSEVVDKDRMFKEKGPRRCIIKAKAWMERSRNHHCHRLPFHGLHLWRSVPLCRWCRRWLRCHQLWHQCRLCHRHPCRQCHRLRQWRRCLRCHSRRCKSRWPCKLRHSCQNQKPSCWRTSGSASPLCLPMYNRRWPSTKVRKQPKIFSLQQNRWLVPKKTTNITNFGMATSLWGD